VSQDCRRTPLSRAQIADFNILKRTLLESSFPPHVFLGFQVTERAKRFMAKQAAAEVCGKTSFYKRLPSASK
jgi:hypothetical protein